jgi:hypothetical protein
MSRTLILIWGGAIFAFLLLSRYGATTSIINSGGGFLNTFTKTLQGRS